MLVKNDHRNEVIIDIYIPTILALDPKDTVAVVGIDAEDGALDFAHKWSIVPSRFLSIGQSDSMGYVKMTNPHKKSLGYLFVGVSGE
jgi:hypothetical protein